jgi:hypothetical protein
MTPTELSQFLGRHDISKDDVAKICGVSLKSFYSWLNGQHPIPRSAAMLLTAYDAGFIELDWIVDFVENDLRQNTPVM